MSVDAPKRVRLSRAKGWRKPENTVVVSRPTKWGNPFADRIPHGESLQPRETRAVLVRQFRAWVMAGMRADDLVEQMPLVDQQGKVWRSKVQAVRRPTLREIREALAGHDLACWCPLDEPCHADVLLEIANGGR